MKHNRIIAQPFVMTLSPPPLEPATYASYGASVNLHKPFLSLSELVRARKQKRLESTRSTKVTYFCAKMTVFCSFFQLFLLLAEMPEINIMILLVSTFSLFYLLCG